MAIMLDDASAAPASIRWGRLKTMARSTNELPLPVDLPRSRDDVSVAWAGETASSVEVVRWQPDRDNGFNVAVVEPHGGFEESVVFPMSHDYRIDPLVVRRLQVLAAMTNRRWIGVDLPGVTMNFEDPVATGASHVPHADLWSAIRGDYSALAQTQWAAVSEIVDVPESVRLVGESLGAQLVSSLATSEFVAPISLDLVEPVNPVRLTIASSLRVSRDLIGLEAERKSVYLDENDRAGWGDVTAFELSSGTHAALDKRLKSLGHQWWYANLPAIGLRHGLARTLEAQSVSTVITIWRGIASTVCPAEGCNALAEALARKGHSAQVMEMRATPGDTTPIGHHILSSLPRLASFGRLLAARWDSADARRSN